MREHHVPTVPSHCRERVREQGRMQGIRLGDCDQRRIEDLHVGGVGLSRTGTSTTHAPQHARSHPVRSPPRRHGSRRAYIRCAGALRSSGAGDPQTIAHRSQPHGCEPLVEVHVRLRLRRPARRANGGSDRDAVSHTTSLRPICENGGHVRHRAHSRHRSCPTHLRAHHRLRTRSADRYGSGPDQAVRIRRQSAI